MSTSTVQNDSQVAATATEDDLFDLDVKVLEAGGGTVPLILLTDDGCKPSCPESCASAVA
ncbi:FxLD family lanthipeptide [Streptomyces uncialis]|uniref:FxLD family lanthipeptide n=1 Tax=Streptomyces uncialis TaxID=1048205 RepID=UPI0038107EA0